MNYDKKKTNANVDKWKEVTRQTEKKTGKVPFPRVGEVDAGVVKIASWKDGFVTPQRRWRRPQRLCRRVWQRILGL